MKPEISKAGQQTEKKRKRQEEKASNSGKKARLVLGKDDLLTEIIAEYNIGLEEEEKIPLHHKSRFEKILSDSNLHIYYYIFDKNYHDFIRFVFAQRVEIKEKINAQFLSGRLLENHLALQNIDAELNLSREDLVTLLKKYLPNERISQEKIVLQDVKKYFYTERIGWLVKAVAAYARLSEAYFLEFSKIISTLLLDHVISGINFYKSFLLSYYNNETSAEIKSGLNYMLLDGSWPYLQCFFPGLTYEELYSPIPSLKNLAEGSLLLGRTLEASIASALTVLNTEKKSSVVDVGAEHREYMENLVTFIESKASVSRENAQKVLNLFYEDPESGLIFSDFNCFAKRYLEQYFNNPNPDLLKVLDFLATPASLQLWNEITIDIDHKRWKEATELLKRAMDSLEESGLSLGDRIDYSVESCTAQIILQSERLIKVNQPNLLERRANLIKLSSQIVGLRNETSRQLQTLINAYGVLIKKSQLEVIETLEAMFLTLLVNTKKDSDALQPASQYLSELQAAPGDVDKSVSSNSNEASVNSPAQPTFFSSQRSAQLKQLWVTHLQKTCTPVCINHLKIDKHTADLADISIDKVTLQLSCEKEAFAWKSWHADIMSLPAQLRETLIDFGSSIQFNQQEKQLILQFIDSEAVTAFQQAVQQYEQENQRMACDNKHSL